MKRILVCLLMVLITLSLFGCSDKPTQDNSSSNNQPVYTNEYLLKDGKSAYTIVVPENPVTMENTAASELVVVFQESTGVELPIVVDTDLRYSDTAKYISIGETNVFETANITVSDTARKTNAFAIKTKGNSLFFVAGGEYGIMNAVYEFLYQTLNFEMFHTDTYTLDKGVTDIRLQAFNFEDAPAITRVLGIQDYFVYNPSLAMRMRVPYNWTNVFAQGPIKVNGNTYNIEQSHTTLSYIPKAEFEATHPNFFSDDRTQLCYTAHGNEEELDMMVDIVVAGMKQNIANNHPQGRYIHNVTNMDGTGTCCACKSCLNMKAKYKGNAGAYVIFFNRVCEKLMDWMQNDEEGKQYYTPEFRIEISSYQAYLDAPVVQDAEGNWQPIDESVIMHPNMIVNVDPVYANFHKNLNADTNKNYRVPFDKWAAVCKGDIMVWAYNHSMGVPLFPLDTFNSCVENYRIYADYNCELFIDQNYDMVRSAWNIYKQWLYAKLAWNPYQNADVLEDRYFAGMYGPAEEAMHRFFDSYRNLSMWQQYEMNFCPQGSTLNNSSVMVKRYWPKNVLDMWMGYVDDAIKALEPLKTTDPVLHERYYKNVVLERVFVEYALVKLYAEALGQDLRIYQQMVIDDMEISEITKLNSIKTEMENALKGGN